MFIFKKILFFLLILNLPVLAQKLKKDDKVLIGNLKQHISYLADDKLEGRRAGTRGEKLAMEYVKSQFEKNGLEPRGENGGFYQPFEIWEGRNFERNSYLFINGEKINAGDYYPLPCSPKVTLQSTPSIALKEAGVPWFVDIRDDLASGKTNPHFNLNRFLTDKATLFSKKGATALLVYNSDAQAVPGMYDPKSIMDTSAIPIIMTSYSVAKKFFADETATLAIRLQIIFEDDFRLGNNVIGYINNGAPTTACIGAHMDHIGYGEDGNSLGAAKDHLIHNGADDNASGIAAMVELARLLKKSKFKSNNYLFIAFSGEELGLFGSKYFLDHPTTNLDDLSFMVNMDMVGRLNDKKILTIGGYGTSPSWPKLFNSLDKNKNFVVRFDTSGSGPSDHTSFYRRNIPVLFFFTGTHSDYHKPTDDADKINYEGENAIVQYIYKIFGSLNKEGKLVFTATKDQQNNTMASFSVTMGIMPDYSFNGPGVRIDGVSDGGPAQKSGLAAGDIIVKLGTFKVSNLEDYMDALSKFKKGDKTQVMVKRVQKTLEAEVVF